MLSAILFVTRNSLELPGQADGCRRRGEPVRCVPATPFCPLMADTAKRFQTGGEVLANIGINGEGLLSCMATSVGCGALRPCHDAC